MKPASRLTLGIVRNKAWLAAVMFILFGAFAFRLWNLGTQSLWHDEAWSLVSSYHPLVPIDPNYPPLYTVLLGIWMRVVGDSVWAMRYFSLLFGVVTVAAATLVMRRWFGKSPAIIAAILVAASPPLWVYSQEIRSYAAMPLFTVILLVLAAAITRPKASISRRTWLWLLLVELLALYDHNLAVPLVAWLNVTVMAIWLCRREWKRLLIWIAAQAGVLLLYLPWLLTQRPTGTPLNTPPQVGLPLLGDIWQSYFTGIKALVDANPVLGLLIAIFGVVTLLAILNVVVRQPNRNTLLVLSQVLLLPTFELIIILAAHIDFHPRYFLLGVIPTLMLVGAGTVSLATQAVRASVGPAIPRRLLWLVPLVGVLSGLAVTAQMAQVLYSDPKYQHDDFLSLAEYYATSLTAKDAIIIPYGWEPTLDYYNRKMPVAAQWISVPLHSSAQTIIAQLQTETQGIHDVEFPTWFQLPADVRGAFPCLLNTNRAISKKYLFSGLSTTAYVASESANALPTPESFQQTANFDGIDLLSMDSYSGTEGACVVTQWKLTQPTKQNWKITVRALNPLGWEIARTDSDLLNDNQLPTVFWQTGQEETAFSLLTLPLGTVPQSSYKVIVSVYGDEAPHGLDVLQDGKPVGKDASIGTVRHPVQADATASPTSSDLDMGGGLFLDHQDVPNDPPQPGQAVRVTLRWLRSQWTSDPQKVTVSLTGQGWQASSDGALYPDPWVLTWHELQVPADASGLAVLQVTTPSGQSKVLAEYDIQAGSHVFTEPPIAQRLSATFQGVGALVGIAAPTTIKAGENFNIDLTWKSGGPSPKPYTVFVHLLDAQGQVIAQSDSQPTSASGDRPTTGWIPDEYIVDTHHMIFNIGSYTGPATIEVGLYDATTGNRVLLDQSADHAVVPGSIDVR